MGRGRGRTNNNNNNNNNNNRYFLRFLEHIQTPRMNLRLKRGIHIIVFAAVGDEKKCVSPFRYEGKTYNSRCTYAGDAERPWCSYDYEYNGRWAHCSK